MESKDVAQKLTWKYGHYILNSRWQLFDKLKEACPTDKTPWLVCDEFNHTLH